MLKLDLKLFLTGFLFFSLVSFSQNETKKWYFGNNAGLDFTSSPPTIITGSMNTNEGCASIAGGTGNTLFYTDGSTVWNQSNAVMANGTGLLGDNSSTQSSIVIKQPGNANIYFVFTNDALGGTNGLRYSTVDMSLAAGQGSVTTKNTLVVTPCTEKLSAVRHCNGIDIWVTVHDVSANNFRSFLVTSGGVSTVPVVSAVGSANVGLVGYMKFSPNGKKLALGTYNASVEVYDFDASTGIVSNSLPISTALVYGVEFSSDGTKLYASASNLMYQWDLCAGNNAAIVASQYTFAATNNNALQLAVDGKIYVARYAQQTLGVINSPNVGGSGCNYVDLGQSIGTNTCNLGLPNFMTSFLKAPPAAFTYTNNNTFGCQTASFTAPPGIQNFPTAGCSASGYSVNTVLWIFGDPSTGASNTSTLTNPTHAFSNLGVYSVKLVLNYNCGSDTVKQNVFIIQPCISVASTSITCATLGSATVQALFGTGPYSYTWMPSGQTGSVATGLAPGTYSIIVFASGSNITATAVTVFTSLIPFTSTITTNGTTCFGTVNGVASINLAGGSGSQSYFWTNGTNTFTTPVAAPLSAGAYTYQVIDAVTSCSLGGTFIITQPPALTLNIGPPTPTSCVGSNIILTGTVSGGTPGYIYSWANGPATSSFAVTENTPGIAIYTLVTSDLNNCTVSKTVSVNYIANPSPTISINTAICIAGTLSLTGSGGGAYFWSGPSSFTSSLQSPTISPLSLNNSGTYSLTVTAANGCAATRTVSALVGTAPTITSNPSPVCAGQTLSLTANSSNGVFYTWAGPSGYNSSAQNSFINQADVNNSGMYTVTATGINNCSASLTLNVTVYPTPSLTAVGSTVCTGKTASLTANSLAGVTYLWSGPSGFSSTQQNTVIVSPTLNQTGTYTVVATSTAGCINTFTVGLALIGLPTASITTNAPLCTGSNFSLTGSGGFLYNWTGPGGFLAFVQNPVINSVAFSNSGVYNLTVTALSGCTGTASASVTINLTPTVSAAGSTVCTSQTLSLTANSTAGASYLWTGPLNYTSNAQNPNIVSPSVNQTGYYTVLVTDVNSCSVTATVPASVTPPPIVTISMSSASLCAQALAGSPNTIILTAAGASAYTVIASNGIFNSNPSGPSSTLSVSPPFQISGATTATVLGSNGSCATSVTAIFTVNTNPANLTISGTPSVCTGQSTTLAANGANTYSWSNTATTSVVAIAPLVTTSYTVKGTDLNGCSNTATVNVTVNPNPATVNVSASPTLICAGESATLSASGASTYVWINASGNSEAVVTPSGATTYTVVGTNFAGCSDAGTVSVVVELCTGIKTAGGKLQILIYPNPAQEFITVQTDNEHSFYTAEITDNLGQVISSTDLHNDTIKTFDVKNLANGIYFLRLKDRSGVTSKPFVISR